MSMSRSYQALFQIKQYREDRQRNRVANANQYLDACRKQLQQNELQLHAYRQWRLTRQEEIYAELHQKPSDPRGLLDYRAKFDALAQQEHALEDALKRAKQDLTHAHQRLNEVRTALAKAVQAREKFEAFLTARTHEAQKIATQKEEAESEEMTLLQHSFSRNVSGKN